MWGATDYSTLARMTSDKMFLSIGVLIELCAIIRMIEQILLPPQWVLTPAASGAQDMSGTPSWRPVKITRTTIWLTLQTLLNHKCWRDYRRLTMHLPELLLGGTFQGVWLQCSDFDEPCQDRPVASVVSSKRMKVLARRRERFQSTLDALERLLAWTQAEHASFTERFLGGRAPQTQ